MYIYFVSSSTVPRWPTGGGGLSARETVRGLGGWRWLTGSGRWPTGLWPLSLEAGAGPRFWAAGEVAVGWWRTGAVRDTECERDSEGQLRSDGERERARERQNRRFRTGTKPEMKRGHIYLQVAERSTDWSSCAASLLPSVSAIVRDFDLEWFWSSWEPS
nr:hypothetical protein Iba_chr02bCG14890 [Ipomoea batatas]